MSQGLSKVDQQVYRSSYRKHKQRLADIRHNVTGKDFFLEAHPRPSDKKGILRNKLKQQEIHYQNNVLKNKINGIKTRTAHQLQPTQIISHTEQVRPQPVRYDQLEDNKIQIQSDFSDGQPVRCIIPNKVRALSFMPRSKPPLKPEIKSFFTSKPEKTYKQKRPESFHRSNNSERAHSQQKHSYNQLYYNLPERNQKRQVIHHKTVILSARQSCLYELSLIGQRILIAAHIMGVDKYCLTELLSEKKTQAVLKEYQGNFQELYSKIILEENNQKYYAIKINLKGSESEFKEKPSDEEMRRKRAKLQNQFIRRNYYDTLKREEDHQSQGSNQKPTITHQKLEDLVQRLAAPKRYLIKDHVYQPPAPQLPKPPVHSKISIHVEGKDIEARVEKMKEHALQIQDHTYKQQSILKRESTPMQQQRMTLKKTESLVIDKESKPLANRQTLNPDQTVISKQGQPQIIQSKIIDNHRAEQQEQEVEYLDGQDEEYQQQFEDPSLVSKGNPQGSIQIENNSYVSRKSKQSIQEPTAKNGTKQKENIQEEEYDNEDYEEVFDQSLPKKDISKQSPAGKNNRSTLQKETEEEYAEQFQS